MVQESKINLELSTDEALVLFEWLSRSNKKNDGALFADAAERRVLVNLEANLERLLVAPFKPNYEGLLTAARNRVRDVE